MTFVKMTALSGVFGASMVCSMISDQLTLMTLHIYIFYRIAARLYHWQLGVLFSLFNLFRGALQFSHET